MKPILYKAKNGRPYIKNENGKVKFISQKQYDEWVDNEKPLWKKIFLFWRD